MKVLKVEVIPLILAMLIVPVAVGAQENDRVSELEARVEHLENMVQRQVEINDNLIGTIGPLLSHTEKLTWRVTRLERQVANLYWSTGYLLVGVAQMNDPDNSELLRDISASTWSRVFEGTQESNDDFMCATASEEQRLVYDDEYCEDSEWVVSDNESEGGHRADSTLTLWVLEEKA